MLKVLACLAPPFFPCKDKELQRNLAEIGFRCSASSYLSMAFLLSIFSTIPILITLPLMGFSPFILVPAVACVFLFLAYYPALEKRRVQNTLDHQLPLVVHSVYCDLVAGETPEKALASLKNFEAFSNQFSTIHRLLLSGLPFSLLSTAVKLPSTNFVKFLAITAKNGKTELKKFYNDLLEEQCNKAKIYAAKSNLTAMFFISIAAVLPAMFSAVALLGSLIGFALTSTQVLFAFAVLFPLLDFAFLYYLQISTPPFW